MPPARCLESSTGVDSFFDLEQGLELQLGPVVAGFVLQQKMWWLSGAIPDELERSVLDGTLFHWIPNASFRVGDATWRDGVRSSRRAYAARVVHPLDPARRRVECRAMPAHRGRIVVLCAALTASAPAALVVPSAAWAQSGDADGTYKVHMQNGVKLYQERNWAGAEAEFRAAYSAKKKASPLVNIALCQKAQFQYPRAIITLQQALSEHGDTLDAADAKAAREAITELESLLAYVSVVVTPADATVRVDGETLAAGAAKKPVPLGPGPHTFSASAPGYASAEQSLTVSSGDKDKKVELRLVADKGYLTVTTSSPKNAIAVDQKYVGTGRWSGLLDPGSHSVFIYLPGSSAGGVGASVEIAAGKLHTVDERDAIMMPIAAGPAGMPDAARPAEPPEPIPDLRGWYALVQGGGFGLLGELTGDFGLTLGGRLGYRASTPIGIEGMLQLDQTPNVGTGQNIIDADNDELGASADLRAIRLGLNLRLMTRGSVARFVGALGGGMSIDSLDYDESSCEDLASEGRTCFAEDNTGVNGFLNTEFGMEFDIRGVFFGFALQQMACTVSSLNAPNIGKFNGFVGFGLRVGYGTW